MWLVFVWVRVLVCFFWFLIWFICFVECVWVLMMVWKVFVVFVGGLMFWRLMVINEILMFKFLRWFWVWVWIVFCVRDFLKVRRLLMVSEVIVLMKVLCMICLSIVFVFFVVKRKCVGLMMWYCMMRFVCMRFLLLEMKLEKWFLVFLIFNFCILVVLRVMILLMGFGRFSVRLDGRLLCIIWLRWRWILVLFELIVEMLVIMSVSVIWSMVMSVVVC